MPAAIVDGITWNYTLSGNNANIDGGKNNGANLSGAIIIPSTINGYPVTGLSERAFFRLSNITSVSIPASVTSIGGSAFEDCTGLTSLTIPNLVTYIGDYAFSGCAGLVSLTIPNLVTYIGEGALLFCSGLVSLTIGNSVTTIGNSAFSGCTGLTSFRIPDSVTSIGSEAFQNTSANLIIAINTRTIGGTTYTSPTTTDIAFFGNPSVTLIIPVYTFTVGSLTWYYTLDASNNASTGAANLRATTLGSNLSGAIIVPSTLNGYAVTSIGDNSFLNCAGLTSVTIPGSVTIIGAQAFYNCTSLTSINIPDSVTSIGGDAFVSTPSNLTVTMNAKTIGGTTYTSPTTTDIAFFGNNSVTLVLPPFTMTITSTTPGVTSGSTTNNSTIALTFTTSKATTDFEVGDISLTNGSLFSSFSGSGSVYTATFTPDGQGLCTIDVSANKFTNADSQNNTAATFTWTFDTVSPGMTITSTTYGVTSGSTTNNATLALTFTSPQATTDFEVGDISVTNGTLSAFAGSGSVYTAIFAPLNQGACTIDVSANKFTYAAGNSNNAATQFTFTFDSVQPTMTITSTTVTSGSNTNNATIALTFTSSKATTNFVVGDISLINGTLSAFSGSGTDYTAIFATTRQGACTIGVAAGAYTDVAGNSNAAANTFSIYYVPNFAYFNNANNLEQTYIKGFLDISGTINNFNGDLRVMDGNLIVRAGDVSLDNGKLYVSGNVSANSNMSVAGITTLTTMVARDNMDVSGASILHGSLTVAGITSLNNHVSIANNKQFTAGVGNAIFGGDVSLNSKLIANNGASLKSSVDVSGSAVFANTVVNGSLLFNTRPSFASDISLNGPNIDICGNLYAQYPANSIPAYAVVGGVGNVIDVDVSMNAGLSVAGATTLSALATSGNATIGGTLNIIGATTMSTLSISNATTIGGTLNVVGKHVFLNDVSFNGSRIDICGNLYAQYPESSIPSSAIIMSGLPIYDTDVSMNAGLFVSNAVKLGSTLVVSGKSALRGDISFNGARVDICGNFYANYPSNIIPQSAVIGGVSRLFNTDVSMNAGLYVKDGIKLDTITIQYQQTPVAGLYVNAALNAPTLSSVNATINSTLTVTGATTLSSTLNVIGAATLGSTLTVAGATTAAALTTTGAVTFMSRLNLPAWSPFNAAVAGRSTLTVVGATTLNSTLTVVGATTLKSGLSVVGATTMKTTLNGVGATTLAEVNAMNILTISGATTIGSTLAVAGATTLASLLTVVGTSRFKGDYAMSSTLNVLGDVSLNSTLNVTGATTLPSLTVAGATVVGGALLVNQTAPFALDVIMSSTLNVLGDVSMNTTLSVGGSTSFRSTLAVTGATTLAALTTTGNATIGDSLIVSGIATFSQDASLNVTNVDIGGIVNAGQVTIGQAALQYRPNNFQIGDQLIPSAGLYIDASLNALSIVTTGSASVGGNLSVTGATTMSKTLFVAGATTFATLSSIGGTTIGGVLNVNGATTVGSTLHINGAVTASSLTINNNTTVGGALTVAAETTMSALNFTGQLLQW